MLMKLWNKIVNIIRHTSVEQFLKFSKKRLKSKVVINLLWWGHWKKVSFSRSRKHKPTKLSWLQSITSRHILMSFGVILLKNSLLPSVYMYFISTDKKHGSKFFSRSIRNQTRFFLFLHIPLATHRNFQNSLKALVRTKFMLRRFSSFWFIVSMEFPWKYRLPGYKNTFNQTSMFIQKLV